MTTRATVDDFLTHGPWAVVGVSRDTKKFGHMAYRELKTRGYRLFPINPNVENIEGDRCYPNLGALPEPAGGALIIVPPAKTERVVQEALAAGIRRVWMQQGAESEAAIRFCQANGVSEVHGECILMHAPNTACFHKMHRWVWGMLGKLPK